jgi:hypothetical protein
VEILERYIRTSILCREVLDNLVDSSFARAVSNVAWLDELAGSRGDIDNSSRAWRFECQKFLDDIESRGDIDIEGCLEFCVGDVFTRSEVVRESDVRNQDVDLANLLQDGRDALEISDRSSIDRDLGLGVLGFQFLLSFIKHFLSSLDKNQMFNAGFGERLGDSKANLSCLERLAYV